MNNLSKLDSVYSLFWLSVLFDILGKKLARFIYRYLYKNLYVPSSILGIINGRYITILVALIILVQFKQYLVLTSHLTIPGFIFIRSFSREYNELQMRHRHSSTRLYWNKQRDDDLMLKFYGMYEQGDILKNKSSQINKERIENENAMGSGLINMSDDVLMKKIWKEK